MAVAAAMALSVWGCTNPDEKFDALKTYLAEQTEVGIYRDGKAVFTFDKTRDQIYMNRSELLFRIQNDDATKYMELTLSDEPKVGATIDVIMLSSGYDNLTSAVFSRMTVTKSADNICFLAGDSSSSYTGIIIVWVE